MGDILSEANEFLSERNGPKTEKAKEPESLLPENILEENEVSEIEKLLSEMVTEGEDVSPEEEEEEEPAYPEEELAIEDLLLKSEEGFSLEDEGALSEVKLSGEELLEEENLWQGDRAEEPLPPTEIIAQEIPQEPIETPAEEESLEDLLGGEEEIPLELPEEPWQQEIPAETQEEESLE
ncbi:hypothetical protein KJ640_01360, partial [bacterium]|nr:hypothetical protein [bacterium]